MDPILEKQRLYQMIVAQLQHDGFTEAAQSVATSSQSLQNPLVQGNRLQELVTVGMRREPEAKGEGCVDLLQGKSLHEGTPKGSGDPHRTCWLAECKVNMKFQKAAKSCAFSPDGAYFVYGSADGTCRMSHTDRVRISAVQDTGDETDLILRQYSLPQAVNAVAFHPTRPLILTGCRDTRIRMFDYRPIAEEGQKRVEEISDNFAIRCLDPHPGGIALAVGTDDRSLRMYDLERKGCYASQLQDEDHAGAINDVKFSMDGRTMVSAGYDGAIRVWDTRMGKSSGAIIKSHEGGPVTSVKMSKRGDAVLSGGYDGRVKLWDLRAGTTGSLIRQYSQLNSGRRAIATFNFSEEIVFGLDETAYQACLWDSTSAEVLERFAQPIISAKQQGGGRPSHHPSQDSCQILCLAASPVDGTYIAGSLDGRVRAFAT